MIYPWLEPAWRRLTERPQAQHHALLCCGSAGIGKLAFAEALLQFVLCSDKAARAPAQACGNCRNCRLLRAGTHPDLHVLTAASAVDGGLLAAYSSRYEEATARPKRTQPSSVISIDQVRLLIRRFATRPYLAATKIALIAPADCLNINAANALLKLLEEPPGQSLLLLVSAEPVRLPATIRSRCLRVELPAPERAESIRWLTGHLPPPRAELLADLSADGPLRLLALEQQGFVDAHRTLLDGIALLAARRSDGVALAARLAQWDFTHLLYCLQRFALDAIKWHSGAGAPVWRDKIALQTSRFSPPGWFFLYHRIGFYRTAAGESVNRQLALEDLLLLLQRLL